MRALILLLLPLSLSAQNCKYHENERDPFTGKNRLVTRANIGVNLSTSFDWYFKRIDSTYMLTLRWTDPAASTIMEDDKLLIKLDNDSILTLRALWTAVPEVDQYYKWTWASYSMERWQIEAIAQSQVAMMRIYGIDGYVDRPLTNARRNKEKVTAAARCLVGAP